MAILGDIKKIVKESAEEVADYTAEKILKPAIRNQNMPNSPRLSESTLKKFQEAIRKTKIKISGSGGRYKISIQFGTKLNKFNRTNRSGKKINLFDIYNLSKYGTTYDIYPKRARVLRFYINSKVIFATKVLNRQKFEGFHLQKVIDKNQSKIDREFYKIFIPKLEKYMINQIERVFK